MPGPNQKHRKNKDVVVKVKRNCNGNSKKKKDPKLQRKIIKKLRTSPFDSN